MLPCAQPSDGLRVFRGDPRLFPRSEVFRRGVGTTSREEDNFADLHRDVELIGQCGCLALKGLVGSGSR